MWHYTGFWTKGAIVRAAPLFILLGILTGCQERGNSQSSSTTGGTQDQLSFEGLLNSVSKQVGGASGNVQEALAPHSEALQAKTKEEVDKLFRWEYRVDDIPLDLTASQLEQRLAALGTEGWECFSLIPSTTTTRTICKRRPKSAIAYLKYLPGL
jgi:hypothetical protein